jgi:hypothetical protein
MTFYNSVQSTTARHKSLQDRQSRTFQLLFTFGKKNWVWTIDKQWHHVRLVFTALRQHTNIFHTSTRRHSIMALQPFVGPWPHSEFINLYTVGKTPWRRDQPVARPLPTHRTTQTRYKRTQISMPRGVFSPRFHCSSRRRQFMPQTAWPLWSAARRHRLSKKTNSLQSTVPSNTPKLYRLGI